MPKVHQSNWKEGEPERLKSLPFFQDAVGGWKSSAARALSLVGRLPADTDMKKPKEAAVRCLEHIFNKSPENKKAQMNLLHLTVLLEGRLERLSQVKVAA